MLGRTFTLSSLLHLKPSPKAHYPPNSGTPFRTGRGKIMIISYNDTFAFLTIWSTFLSVPSLFGVKVVPKSPPSKRLSEIIRPYYNFLFSFL